jgi:1,4-dihydroxy-2-naphthoate octaprenyltransferase
LPLGAISLAGAYLYSGGPRPLASQGLGEVTVFVFFGLIAVGGSYFAQVGSVTPHAWLGAVAVGLPISAIMLVNNIRDIATDRRAGKHTLAVRLGENKSRKLYAVLILCPTLTIAFPAHGQTVWSAVMAMTCLVLGGSLVSQITRLQGSDLNPLLGKTANFSVLVAVLYAIAR